MLNPKNLSNEELTNYLFSTSDPLVAELCSRLETLMDQYEELNNEVGESIDKIDDFLYTYEEDNRGEKIDSKRA